MPSRLLADTCAALKLAALGEKIFKAGLLASGDLILHPLLFQETKKWTPERKKRFDKEFAVLAKVSFAVNLRPPKEKLEAMLEAISMAQDAVGRRIGRVDSEILAAVLCDGNMGLVTNDIALGIVAEDGLAVAVSMAEDIICEALVAGCVTTQEVEALLKRWQSTGDTLAPGYDKKLGELGVKIPK